MEPSTDQQSTEEVKQWSTTTTTKTWTSTSTSSTSETLQQGDEVNVDLNQLALDNSTTTDSRKLLENINTSTNTTQGKDIKINVDNKSGNQVNTQKTSSTSTMQSSTTTTITEVREVAVAEHNKLRRVHGAPDVKPDARLNDEAQRYAEVLAKGSRDNFKTSKTGTYGENIATSSKKDKVEAIKDAITRMYDTSKFYDYQRPGFNVDGKPTGLFTSIVWKSVERIGVGCAWNQVEENYSIVFYYDPMTNISTEFKDNVLPPRA